MRDFNPMPSLRRLRLWFDYDQETGVLRWKRYASGKAPKGSIAGKIDKEGYRVVQFREKQYASHRICWYLATGKDPGRLVVDHENGIKTDNRFTNLRLATSGQNACNAKKPSHNSSGFKNVCWNRNLHCWVVMVKKDGKSHFIGITPDLAEAAGMAVLARLRLHQGFARHQ